MKNPATAYVPTVAGFFCRCQSFIRQAKKAGDDRKTKVYFTDAPQGTIFVAENNPPLETVQENGATCYKVDTSKQCAPNLNANGEEYYEVPPTGRFLFAGTGRETLRTYVFPAAGRYSLKRGRLRQPQKGGP